MDKFSPIYIDENDRHRAKFNGNSMILIYSSAGFGKSLLSEGMIEEYYNKGYVVITVSDRKDKFETCFNMFEPQEKYHRDLLRKIGKTPKAMPIKIYHPFTFSIPKKNIPKINFFTIPIKDLAKEELAFLFETRSDSNNLKIVTESLLKLKRNQGLYWLIQNITEELTTEDDRVGTKSIPRPRGEFSTPDSITGTRTNLGEIITTFLPFTRDYMLGSDDCDLNLDVDEILKDNKHYHCLSTKYIKDEKMKYFAMYSFLKKIIDGLDNSKNPVVILFEEIGAMFPRDAKAFQDSFANEVIPKLLILRSKGRGCTIIATTQTLTGLNVDLEQGFSEKLIGHLGSVKEIGSIAKNLRFSKELIDKLYSLKRLRFMHLASMEEQSEPIVGFPPSGCHAEETYQFEEIYQKHNQINPDKYPMQSFRETLDLMEDIKQKDKKESKENADKAYKNKLRQLEELNEARKKKAEEKSEQENKKEEMKVQKTFSKQEIMKRVYEIKKSAEKIGENPSWRSIAEQIRTEYKCKIDHKTVSNYYRIYSEQEALNYDKVKF